MGIELADSLGLNDAQGRKMDSLLELVLWENVLTGPAHMHTHRGGVGELMSRYVRGRAWPARSERYEVCAY